MKKIFRVISIIAAFSLILGILSSGFTSHAEDSSFIHARPSANGQLSVKGTQLVDKNGSPVILKGISLHGLTHLVPRLYI